MRLNHALLLIFVLGLLPAWGQQSSASGVSWQAVRRGAVYESYMIEIAAKEGIDPRWLWVVGYLESKFVHSAESHAGALGMMQFMPMTAARFGIKNIYDPYQSISGAAKYLGFLSRRYKGDVYSVLAGYNAGEGAVDAFLAGEAKVLPSGKVINPKKLKTPHGIPDYRETMNYVAEGVRLLALMPYLAGKVVVPMEAVKAEGPPTNEAKSEVAEKSEKKAVLYEDATTPKKEAASQAESAEEKPKPKGKSVIF